MKFKELQMQAQLNKAAQKLQEVVKYADDIAIQCADKELIITRVSDPVPGESGVHVAIPCRGTDARGEYATETGIQPRYTEEEVQYIIGAVNKKFPRTDGKLCAIYHHFGDGPMHFHFQTPYEWLTEDEKRLS